MNGVALPEGTQRWIWPFELLERIGEGGMGLVYRARYVVKDLEVALKMIPNDVTDEVTLARFEREMEVLKTLKHPNIVRTFGGVSEDRQRFYAMELISGGSLEDELSRSGRLHWPRVIELGQQMCSALDYLHRQGVVHRDVKPSNFLMTSSGVCKLSDFGLASVVAQRRITAEGRTAGTFLYMAPEQIRGETVTPRTDLYALGCVFFELLSGQPPFVGDTPAATLHMHCKLPPPRVAAEALDCPVALERIILRLLEKDPRDRFASAADVSEALAEVTDNVEVVAARTLDGRRPLGNMPVAERPRKPSAPTQQARALPSRERPPWRTILDYALPVVTGLLLIWSFTLSRRVEHGEVAIAQWHEAAASPQPAVRIEAARRLVEIHKNDADELKPVIELMTSDPDPDVRAAAAQAFTNVGPGARPLLPQVTKALKDETDLRVREQLTVARTHLQQL